MKTKTNTVKILFDLGRYISAWDRLPWENRVAQGDEINPDGTYSKNTLHAFCKETSTVFVEQLQSKQTLKENMLNT